MSDDPRNSWRWKAASPREMGRQDMMPKIERLRDALYGLLERYTAVVDSGDCGFWDPEQENEVIAARNALAETETKTTIQTPAKG